MCCVPRCRLDFLLLASLSLPCLDVMQEVQKYFKILLWNKKDGFCKNKKKIFLAEQDLQGHCPHNVPAGSLHSPCSICPHGGVQSCVRRLGTLKWMGCRGALKADPIRLPRETTGISRQIFWYNTQPRYIYICICINRRISQRHFILFTVQKLTVFHKDFNN